MSTEIGELKSTGSRGVPMLLTRYAGGEDKGPCIRLIARTEEGEDGYIQLSASDIIALLPIFKKYIIDAALESKKAEAEAAIKECKELEKSIVADMRTVSEMAIAQPVFDMAALLCLGKSEFVPSDGIKGEEK